jgi:hypothetical protein
MISLMMAVVAAIETCWNVLLQNNQQIRRGISSSFISTRFVTPLDN